MNKITSSCLLRNNTLSVNGKEIFKQPGDLDRFLEGAYRMLKVDYPRFYKMDRLAKAGFITSEAVLPSSIGNYPASAVSLVLSNSNASLDTDIRYFESTKSFASPSLFVYTLPNIVAGEICIRHKLKGENTFFISAEFDAGMITQYVDLVMAQRQTKACLAGWIDLLKNDAEVFLYLTENTGGEQGIDHNAPNVLELYRAWNN